MDIDLRQSLKKLLRKVNWIEHFLLRLCCLAGVQRTPYLHLFTLSSGTIVDTAYLLFIVGNLLRYIMKFQLKKNVFLSAQQLLMYLKYLNKITTGFYLCKSSSSGVYFNTQDGGACDAEFCVL